MSFPDKTMEEYTVRVYEDRIEWLQDGKFSRIGGPAIVYKDGTKEWLFEGNPHRTDGPSQMWADGTNEWFLAGKEYTEEEFLKRTSPELAVVAEPEDSILAENRRLREQVRELSSGLKDATSAVLKLSEALLLKMGKIKRLTKTTGDLKRELSYWEGKCLLAREALVEEEDEPKPPVRETK